jgi:hypothetical protein
MVGSTSDRRARKVIIFGLKGSMIAIVRIFSSSRSVAGGNAKHRLGRFHQRPHYKCVALRSNSIDARHCKRPASENWPT